MHELVERIQEPELCYVFARNATRRGHPELAIQAYRRAVDLRAEQHDADNEAERDALRVIYAYEEALSYRKGKRIRATGTWQLVNKAGLIAAVQRRLESGTAEDVTPVLEELGMEAYSFQAFGARHPEAASKVAA